MARLTELFQRSCDYLERGRRQRTCFAQCSGDAAPISREFRLQISTAGEAVRLEFPIRIEIR
jgi:hypothetical protein